MKFPTVSICVPAFELGGRGVPMLTKLFESVMMQTYEDFEVVVSDHSTGDEIKNLCGDWEGDLPINYVVNGRARGSCEANLNNAIEHTVHGICGVVFDVRIQGGRVFRLL